MYRYKGGPLIENTKKGYKVRLHRDEKSCNLEGLIFQSDEFFTDGIFAVPSPKTSARYNIPALDKYCENKGVKPSELTEDELKVFVI